MFALVLLYFLQKKKEMKPTEIIIGCIGIVVIFKCLSACTTTMCMTWHTYMGKLLLTCNVSNMEFTISITNQRTNSTAFCNLNGVCSKDGTLTVDNLSNVTTMSLTVSNRSEINNDRWTCEHGTNRDQTSVDVTINQDTPTKNDTSTEKENCIQLQLFAALTGFVVPFVMIFFVLAAVAVKQKRQFTIVLSRVELIILFVLGICVFILPIVIGIVTKKYCEYGFIAIWGISLGVGSCITLFKDVLLEFCNRETLTNNDPQNIALVGGQSTPN